MDQNTTSSVPAAPIPQVTSAQKPPPKSNPWIYLLSIFTLILGIALGYVLFKTLPGIKTVNTSLPESTKEVKEITLPTDAVKIQLCSDHRGSLYIKPQDIPVGPVYMVNEGKVIGIEYMLEKDQVLDGQSYKGLTGLGIKIDHVNIGLLSQGHEGFTAPHYHVDLYSVSKDVEQAIVCPTTDIPSPQATQSATPK